MSEHGFVAYGWYVPEEKSKQPHDAEKRQTIPYVLLHFYVEASPSLFETSDEPKVMIPWRAPDAAVRAFHPEHRSLFWDGGTAEIFRGEKLVVPKVHALLAKGQTFLFKEQEAAAAWCSSIEEIQEVLKRTLYVNVQRD